MKNPSQKQIINALNGLESQVDHVRDMVKKAIPNKEWINTEEFARRAKLKRRTVANYAGKGRIKKIKRTQAGHYLIHISELEKWE